MAVKMKQEGRRMAGEQKTKKAKSARESGRISRKVFCSYCRLLYDRHLVTGVGGNLSVRAGEEFLIRRQGAGRKCAPPPLTPGFVYYAYPMPMVPFMVPGTKELADETVRQFASTESSAVLLQNHGLVTVGRSFEEAFNVAEEVEEAARVYLETGFKGHVIPEEGVARIKQLRRKEQSA